MIRPMQSTSHSSSVARIGRSYPRPYSAPAEAESSSIGRFHVAGGLVALVLALGLVGWFLAR